MKTHTNIAIIATTVILLLSLLVAASDADPESGTGGSLPSSHMIVFPGTSR